jgi:demethylmenaquinone methyltransferase/2-methoxy-6-polyprenyl-1,4-benzoquinol methylase
MPDESRERDTTPAPGEATTDRVQGIFASIAPSYDSFNRLSSMGVDRGWRRATVRAAHLERSSRVLDMCAGTGDLTFAMAAGGTAAEVVGTDFVPEMLDIAREKAATYDGPASVSFQVADAQDLPFEDGSFDVACVGFGVRNLPDRKQNFREVYRVLRRGGRYVILEFSRPPLAPFRWGYHFYLRTVIPALGGALTGDKPSFDYLNESIKRFPSQPALAAELRAAGFTAISWQNLTGGIVAIHTSVK